MPDQLLTLRCELAARDEERGAGFGRPTAHLAEIFAGLDAGVVGEARTLPERRGDLARLRGEDGLLAPGPLRLGCELLLVVTGSLQAPLRHAGVVAGPRCLAGGMGMIGRVRKRRLGLGREGAARLRFGGGVFSVCPRCLELSGEARTAFLKLVRSLPHRFGLTGQLVQLGKDC